MMLLDIEVLATILGLVESITIVVFYTIAAYYTRRWFKLSGKHYYSPVKVAYFVTHILFTVVFTTVAVSTLIGHPLVAATSFGAIVIRPVILLAGVVSAIAARVRYVGLVIGEHKYGEH